MPSVFGTAHLRLWLLACSGLLLVVVVKYDVCSEAEVALLSEGDREQALLREARVVTVWLLVWVLFGGRLRTDLSSVTELGC